MVLPAHKSSHACKQCRSLKVRCLPSDIAGAPCQKCTRSGAACFFEERSHIPRRRREKPDSRARVAALESKLEDLIAQVQVSKNNESPTNSTPPMDTFLPTPESLRKISTPQSQQSRPGQSSWNADEFTPRALLQTGHLSLDTAEGFLDQYQKMCNYFPYVILPADISLSTMLRHRPFLLHSALAVASSSKVTLQKALERSLRETLLRRVLLDGEKNLDLLQALLVSLAWGHFFHVPKKEQSFQMLQMAISLCVDLGLNLSPAEARARKVGLSLEHHQECSDQQDDYFSREARRAYLGCYHFSSTSSWIWAKPNNVEYTEYLLQCAISLSTDPEFASDHQILPLTQLSQIGNEYHGAFQDSFRDNQSQIDTCRMEAHFQSFQRRLREFKASLSPVGLQSPLVDLTYHFTSTYVYEMDLLNPFVSKRKAALTNTSKVGASVGSRIRTEITTNCLVSAMAFVDRFLEEIPWTKYCNISQIQWSGLVYSTVVIYRLSIGTPQTLFWDVQVARDSARLELYLEKLCYRLQKATRGRLEEMPKNAGRDLFTLMGLIFENVKNTYERLRPLPQNASSTDEKPVHATSFPDVNAMKEQHREGVLDESHVSQNPRFQHPCPAFQFWKEQGTAQVDDSNRESYAFEGDNPFPTLNFEAMTDDNSWMGSLPDFEMDERFPWNLGI